MQTDRELAYTSANDGRATYRLTKTQLIYLSLSVNIGGSSNDWLIMLYACNESYRSINTQ